MVTNLCSFEFSILIFELLFFRLVTNANWEILTTKYLRVLISTCTLIFLDPVSYFCFLGMFPIFRWVFECF